MTAVYKFYSENEYLLRKLQFFFLFCNKRHFLKITTAVIGSVAHGVYNWSQIVRNGTTAADSKILGCCWKDREREREKERERERKRERERERERMVEE